MFFLHRITERNVQTLTKIDADFTVVSGSMNSFSVLLSTSTQQNLIVVGQNCELLGGLGKEAASADFPRFAANSHVVYDVG